jgi:hypothetical protein
MSYKPDETVWMAYLYDELSGEEKERVEQYLQENPQALQEFQHLQHVRQMLATVEDKEVIAPPIVVESSNQRFFWNVPYFKTITSIAASLLLVMLVGKLTGLQVNYSNQELRIGFNTAVESSPETFLSAETLTASQVQQMIDASMQENNKAMLASLDENQQKLHESVQRNLATNSARVNELVQQVSLASQDQIRQFVAGLQTENQELVKNYFQLTASEQQKYIEGVLVDFAKYLQQQRNSDLDMLQTRLTSIEQNTSVFKQETEQILSSIIATNAAPSNASRSY